MTGITTVNPKGESYDVDRQVLQPRRETAAGFLLNRDAAQRWGPEALSFVGEGHPSDFGLPKYIGRPSAQTFSDFLAKGVLHGSHVARRRGRKELML